ncbi:MAG: DUF6794 domain-containing protein [Candidatus Paceibacterota bacterium]|jgi:hypothetical protein
MTTIPTTLTEALDYLDAHTSGADKAYFLSHTDSHFHHGAGTAMRNGFDLWNPDGALHKWFVAHGFSHPDDMSSVIFKAFRTRLQGGEIDLPKEAAWYKRYWEESARLGECGTMSFKVDKDGGLVYPWEET